MIVTLKQFSLFLRDIILFLKPKSFKDLPSRVVLGCKDFFVKSKCEWGDLNKKMRNLVNTNINLGLYHLYRGNKDDACFRFRLLKFCMSDVKPSVYYNLGRCYAINKKFNKARKLFCDALEKQENYPEVEYALNKIDDVSKIEKVPLSVIRQRFDFMASYYVEEFVMKRKYRGYDIILYEITDYLNNRSRESIVLDVGCGTGVCGHFLKMNHVGRKIVGIDLSSEMLDISENCYVRDMPVYDEVLNVSAEEYFAKLCENNRFDIIIAVDSLGYERELYQRFSEFKLALTEGGFILCIMRLSSGASVEFLPDLDMFCYSQDYILHLSSRLRMKAVKVVKCQLYDNINGLLCMLVKE